MEFGLNEDQRLIDQSLRGFLADAVGMDQIRDMAEKRTGFDPKLWSGLCELGLPGLMIPEHLGGAGLGMLEAAVVAEALGHAAATAPFAGACVMAPLAILLGGSEEQQQQWLPAMARGEARLGVACGALSGATGTADLSLSGTQLSGQVSGVLDSGGANHVLVFLDDGKAMIVALDDTSDNMGATLTPRPSLDRTRPLADLTLENVEVVALDNVGDAMEMAHRVLDAGRLMLAADTLGRANACWRRPWNTPISGYSSDVSSPPTRQLSTCAQRWPQHLNRAGLWSGMGPIFRRATIQLNAGSWPVWRNHIWQKLAGMSPAPPRKCTAAWASRT